MKQHVDLRQVPDERRSDVTMDWQRCAGQVADLN